VKERSRSGFKLLITTIAAIAIVVVSNLISTTAVSNIDAASMEVKPEIVTGSEYYVDPRGSSSGNGSLANPWDLQTALAHPPVVQPGDTIWLRGGTYNGLYNSKLTGAESAPIIIRSFPGEWAVIDTQATSTGGNAFVVESHWTTYWDFELMNSRTTDRGGGIEFGGGRNNKLINLVIHDMAGGNSFGESNEIYGSILYNNGVDGGFLAHQLYTQNDDASRPARIIDSIIFNGFAFGVHAYAGGVGQLNGIHMIGNTWFNNGAAQTIGDRKDNVLVGGVNGTSNILLQENMGWAFSPAERSVALGRYSDLNQDITLIDNYLVGNTKLFNTWQSVTMTGNTFYSMSPGNGTNFDPTQFPNNLYLTTRPTGAQVFIRPNQYEQGRAHIVVYNWDLASTVNVDLSGLLKPGEAYEVRNGQNYFAPPVVSGIYNGGQVALPMMGLEPAQPIGWGRIAPAERTGPEFNVFVLIKTGAVPNTPTNTPTPTPTTTPTVTPTTTPTATPTATTIPLVTPRSGTPHFSYLSLLMN
jgi:hypothetical protein